MHKNNIFASGEFSMSLLAASSRVCLIFLVIKLYMEGVSVKLAINILSWIQATSADFRENLIN